jgi:hypothetical protein
MSPLIINCSFSALSGLIIYISLIVIQQKWVNTLHYLITYLLLPPIAFVITNVISNNLALSLGMIGALSIVRFRNPVKNPLELVIFFGLLTLGISFAVNVKWGFFLLIFIVAILIFAKLIEVIFKKYNLFDLFNYSFSTNDGELNNLIEIESKIQLDYLETNPNLVYYAKEDDSLYIYKIASNDRKKIDNLKNKLQSDNQIKNLEVRYVNK